MAGANDLDPHRKTGKNYFELELFGMPADARRVVQGDRGTLQGGDGALAVLHGAGGRVAAGQAPPHVGRDVAPEVEGVHVSACVPACLPACLPTRPPAHLPTCPPAHLPCMLQKLVEKRSQQLRTCFECVHLFALDVGIAEVNLSDSSQDETTIEFVDRVSHVMLAPMEEDNSTSQRPLTRLVLCI
eukprot:SAG22_NODE_2211_length_2832_cov_2.111965_4_plen_186_part_00